MTPASDATTTHLIELSVGRIMRSDALLAVHATRMRLTRTLLNASYRRLVGRTRMGGASASATAAIDGPAMVPVRPTGPTIGERMIGWSDHGSQEVRAGWVGFGHDGSRHANESVRATTALLDLAAADLACLAQAAIVLGLSNAAEALAGAAYRMLDGELSSQTEAATASVMKALVAARLSEPSEDA